MRGELTHPVIAAKYAYTILAREFGGSVREWAQKPQSEIEFHALVLKAEQEQRNLQETEVAAIQAATQQQQW